MTVGTSSLVHLRDVANSLLHESLYDQKAYILHVLIKLFVVAHHSLLPAYQWSWIDISRRVNVDPGELATEHIDDLLEAISAKFWPNEKVFVVIYFLKCRTLILNGLPIPRAELLDS
jgi:Generalcontrol nonderepressible 1 (Gcn1) N-terminal